MASILEKIQVNKDGTVSVKMGSTLKPSVLRSILGVAEQEAPTGSKKSEPE